MNESVKGTTVERRKKILSILAEDGQVFVNPLSKMFGVSEVTIRNDLDQLEQKNLLLRARGGALKLEVGVGIDQRISEKDKINFQEKSAIGRVAASMINESDTIILDSGTTTAEIAKNVKDVSNLSIITNALNIVNILSHNQKINLIIPGGFLRQNSLSLVGPIAEKNIRNFYVDKVFLGVDGFDSRLGAYTPNIDEASLNQVMIEISREVVIVMDSSKFMRKSLAHICGLDKIDTIITDNGISQDERKRLEDAGIKMVVV